MPPWLDTAEEVGALLVAVLGVLGTVGAGIVLSAVGVVVVAVKAWRSKVEPVLTSTQAAAETAADQLTPNHGSSVRDALTRIERSLDRLHSDVRLDREQVGRRLEHLEHSRFAPTAHTAPSPITEHTQP